MAYNSELFIMDNLIFFFGLLSNHGHSDVAFLRWLCCQEGGRCRCSYHDLTWEPPLFWWTLFHMLYPEKSCYLFQTMGMAHRWNSCVNYEYGTEAKYNILNTFHVVYYNGFLTAATSCIEILILHCNYRRNNYCLSNDQRNFPHTRIISASLT